MYYIVLQYAAIACKSEMIPLEHGTTPSGQDPTGNCPHRSWPPEQRFAVNCERFGMLYVTPEMWKKTHSTDQQTMVNYCKFGFDHGHIMATHGISWHIQSAICLPLFCLWPVDPHLEANSRDDSVRILGLAEQVLTQWTQWTHGTRGAPRKHPETIRKSVKISEVKCKDVSK